MESYRKLNREKAVREARLWYYANREYALEMQRKWHFENRDLAREIRRRWRENNPIKWRDAMMRSRHKRRAREFAAGVYHETVNYIELYARHDGLCALCGNPVEYGKVSWDHIVPLSRDGWHTEDNLQPTHLVCNCIKGDRTVAWAVARIEFLNGLNSDGEPLLQPYLDFFDT